MAYQQPYPQPYPQQPSNNPYAGGQVAPQSVGPGVQPVTTPLFAPRWTTMLCDCKEPTICFDDWICSLFCLPCAQAKAKSQADGSDPLYNCCCWNCLSTNNWIRRAYHIEGSCGEDCVCGAFCGPCLTRRDLTESRLRRQVPLLRGPNAPSAWTSGLFACGCCALFEALLCPGCVVHRIRRRLQPPLGEDGTEMWYDCCCVLPTAMWGQTRHMFGIKPQYAGECVDDNIIPLFCCPCALTQADRESRTRYESMPHLWGKEHSKKAAIISKVTGGFCT